jgi:hypothetical protein
MPKDNIDYSNTIIYKIICNDSRVTDIYVGHTTNFIKRKYQHKILCNNSSKLKIYDVIRKNGGWDNWSMVEIGKYFCQDVTEARIREQEHYELLKPSLNVVNPISSNKYSVLAIDDSISIQKTNDNSEYKFYCNFCDYGTSKKSSFDDHLVSARHKNRRLGDSKLTNSAAILPNTYKFICSNCSRPYQSRNGLWKHQKKCIEDSVEENSANIKESLLSDKELMMMLVKQNSQLMEVLKNGTNNSNHSHNTNNNHSHNKTFNLQFFLNETCKDAMNINDFVSSIKPQLEDLEATGRLGYVEGISNIILNNLKTLQIHDRPIHCSDQKREVIYIKDNNEWTKEEDNKPILTKAIKKIANENIKNIKEWQNEYPDCTNADSRNNNLDLKIVSNSMSGGSAEESSKNINKIISNVAKQVVIDKSINKIETI